MTTMSELKIKGESQRLKIHHSASNANVWFDQGDNDGVHISGYISFDEMAEIVDFVRSEQVINPLGNMQVGGNHYQKKIQPVEYIHANDLPFIEGNVVKYISRHKAKGGADDIEKAISYCKILLKLDYGYTDEQIGKLFEK